MEEPGHDRNRAFRRRRRQRLKARAAAQGLSLKAWLKKLAEEETASAKPLKSAYGLLAEYGPVPSAEEIDENQRDMFRGFGGNL